MIHDSPTKRVTKVIVSREELDHLKEAGLDGLPSNGFVQLDFTRGGYLVRVRPTGLPPHALSHLENMARRHLKREGVLT